MHLERETTECCKTHRNWGDERASLRSQTQASGSRHRGAASGSPQAKSSRPQPTTRGTHHPFWRVGWTTEHPSPQCQSQNKTRPMCTRGPWYFCPLLGRRLSADSHTVTPPGAETHVKTAQCPTDSSQVDACGETCTNTHRREGVLSGALHLFPSETAPRNRSKLDRPLLQEKGTESPKCRGVHTHTQTLRHADCMAP